MKRIAFTSALFVVAFASSACVTRTSYVDLYGQAAPVSGGERTIVITPTTNHVNVEGGEVIRFVVGSHEFAWAFNVARTVHSFNLNDIAPPGVLNHVVRAYVTPDPKYIEASAAAGE